MRPTRDGMNAEVCSPQITSVAVTAEAISPGGIDKAASHRRVAGNHVGDRLQARARGA
jgi:hypothetical protein